ncbi:MAG: TetR/AcrR family transcriptional regulator [Bacteroidia bacterium]|nr:TetR/AcrR family transcriptional regulator [Bacteroidia bacterium]
MQDKKSFHSFVADLETTIDKMTTEEKILVGAEDLFFKYGIRSVTMDDIAKHLGMSKKTIYQYYKEKDEIIHKLMQAHIKKDECTFSESYERAANIVDEVFSMMKNIQEIFSKINPQLFYEMQKYYPQTWKLFKEFKEDFILNMVQKSLEKGIKEGHVRPDVDIKVLSRLRMEQIEWAMNPASFPPDKFKIVDVQLVLVENFLYGICTLKGHKLINKYKEVTEEE